MNLIRNCVGYRIGTFVGFVSGMVATTTGIALFMKMYNVFNKEEKENE